jgi:hypothetical protein
MFHANVSYAVRVGVWRQRLSIEAYEDVINTAISFSFATSEGTKDVALDGDEGTISSTDIVTLSVFWLPTSQLVCKHPLHTLALWCSELSCGAITSFPSRVD